MKKIIVLLAAVLFLLPALAFAEGPREGTAAGEVVAGMQLEGDGKVHYYANIQAYEKETGKTFPALSESPYIKNMGVMAKVADRVPEEPLVLMPSYKTGLYGGTLRDPQYTGAQLDFLEDLMREFPIMYSADMQDIVPNVFQSWEITNNNKTFTFKLRKGMKWSDGEPFTSADFVYWFDQMANNTELYPGGVQNMKVGGVMGTVKAAGDYSVVMDFPDSYGVVIERMCRWRPMPYAPAHYLKQFHPDFVPKAELDKKVKDGGYNSWVDLHQDGYYWYNNPEAPTIFSWKVLNKVSEPVHQLERNPYYWKVDAAGQQLPYFDRMDRPNVGERGQMVLMTIAGDFDYMHPYHTNYAENFPILKKNEEAGNYKLLPTAGWSDCIGTVNFNFSSEDPFKRELFNQKNFRIALSHALNREEINNTRFKGMYGTPSSPAPPDGPPYYGESEQFHRYAKFDPDKANKLLDELGLKWDSKKEERLRPDGSRLNITMLVYIGWGQSVEVSEMYKKYWDDVGINVNLRPLSSALLSEQRGASQHDLAFGPVNWGGRRPIIALLRGEQTPLGPDWKINPKWGAWIMSDGKQGEEPPEAAKRLRELHLLFVAEADPAVRQKYEEELYKIHNDEFWTLTSIKQPADLPQVYYTAIANNLKNVAVPVAPEWYYCQTSTWYREEK